MSSSSPSDAEVKGSTALLRCFAFCCFFAARLIQRDIAAALCSGLRSAVSAWCSGEGGVPNPSSGGSFRRCCCSFENRIRIFLRCGDGVLMGC